MKVLTLVHERVATAKKWLFQLSLVKKIFIVGILIAGIWLAKSSLAAQKNQIPQYQTGQIEKGTLVTTISGSGSITSGNSTSITTAATGIVNTVFVSNGESVKKGQRIAEITLDEYAQQKRTAAWVAYLDAQEAVKTAQKNKITADIDMWKARQAIIDAEDDIEYKNNNSTNPDTKKEYTDSERIIIDKSLQQARLAFDEAELKYKNADSEIQNAKAKVSATLKDYQELSSIITAPAEGTVSNLALSPGVVIDSPESDNDDNTNTTISSQKIGQIDNKDGHFQAAVNLSELDIVSVKANQKVSLTLDAFPEMSFTGKVLAVDTSGTSSSGVTSYPVTVLLDATTVNIYPKMAVTADIITNVQTDVLLVPSSAVQTVNDISTVQIMKEGQPETVLVEIGDTNGTQTIITSGLNEGETVITATITSDTTSPKNSNTTSPFSTFSGTGSRSTGSFRMEGAGGGNVIMFSKPGM